MKQTTFLRKKIAMIVSATVCAIAFSAAPFALADDTTTTGTGTTTTGTGTTTTGTGTTTTGTGTDTTGSGSGIGSGGSGGTDNSALIAQIQALIDKLGQNDPTNSNSQLLSAINNLGNQLNSSGFEKLGNKIEAIALSVMNYVNSMTYQYNPDLPNTISSNTAQIMDQSSNTLLTPEQFSRAQAKLTTQQTTNNTLAQIAFSITPPQSNNAMADYAANYQDYLNNNSVTTLTQGIKASDSPFYVARNLFFTAYPSDPDAQFVLKPADQATLDKNNKIFNFSNLITPTQYSISDPNAFTSDEGIAATRFIQYASKNFKPVGDGVNFNQLRNASASDLYKFITSPDFQKFQLNTRSQIAQRSIAQTLLNELVAERTPIKGFCVAPDKCNVSPLEAQKYIATRRSTDSKWYRQMAVASPATVQREILMVLVEMQRQGYQSHLDNERIISALSTLVMQNNDSAEMTAQVTAIKLNRQIDNLLKVQNKNYTPTEEDAKNYMPDGGPQPGKK